MSALSTDISTCVPTTNVSLLTECLTQPIGFCSAGIIDQCGKNGLCLPDASGLSRFVCSCTLYYDPAVNCTKTYFESMPADMAFQLFAYLGIILMVFLYGIELIANLRSRGCRYLKTLLGWTTIITLGVYIPLQLACIIIRTQCYNTGNVLPMQIESVLFLIAVTVEIVLHMFTCIEWMNILLKAKNLGINPLSIRITRICLIIITAVGIPLATITGMVYYMQISISVTTAMGLASKYVTIVAVVIPLGVVIAFSIWTFIKIKNITKGSQVSRRIKLVKRRTIMQICATAVSIANAIYLWSTPQLLYQKVESVLFRDVAGYLYLFLTAIFTFLFLTNFYERFPYQHFDAIRGVKGRRMSSDSNSSGSGSRNGTPATDQTTTGSGSMSSGKKESTTSSSTTA